MLGADERIPARRALDLFLAPLDDPAGPPRRVAVGAPADLCLLAEPLDVALADPAAVTRRATTDPRRPPGRDRVQPGGSSAMTPAACSLAIASSS